VASGDHPLKRNNAADPSAAAVDEAAIQSNTCVKGGRWPRSL